MRRVLVLAVAALIGMGATPVLADHTINHEELLFEIVLELESDQDPAMYAPYFLGQLGVPQKEQAARVNHIYEVAINGFSVYLTGPEIEKADRLFGDGGSLGIKSITESVEVTVPVLNGVQGMTPSRLHRTAQVVPTGVQRIFAASGDFSAVDVAVIDTGVDAHHPDLNVVGGYNCVDDEKDGWGHDGYGHGTHVAGTIGALDNGAGVVGVSPGARIHAVKVLNDAGMGTTASVICGIDWVAQHSDDIEIANMSLGGLGNPTACGESDPMHNAICVATEQTIFVVAAGNSAADSVSHSPANYPEVVTVSAFADFDGQAGGAGMPPQSKCAASSVDDELATFSNWGDDVDISAPGTCIFSTLPGEVTDDGVYVAQYGYASGTSMASPHVAGAIARYLAANPDQLDRAVEQTLTWSDANGGPVEGDHDSEREPLLFVGQGAPRYETPVDAPPEG